MTKKATASKKAPAKVAKPAKAAAAPRTAAAHREAVAADADIAASESKSGAKGPGLPTVMTDGSLKPNDTKKRAAAKAAIANAEPRDLKVTATQTGYYDERRYREGDVFLVAASAFSEKWMARVDPRTPESITTGQQQIDKAHDETLKDRLGTQTGNADVI